MFLIRLRNSLLKSKGCSYLEADLEGGVGGFSLAKRIKGTVPRVVIAFCIKRKNPNLFRFSRVSSPSLSSIIPAATMKPIMQPMGKAKPPSAVEKALSLSPNHALASLLEEFMKKPCPKEAIIVPIKEYPNTSNAYTNCLNHAPTNKKHAPIVTQERRPYLVCTLMTTKFDGIYIIPKRIA